MNGEIKLVGQFATDWIRYSHYEIKSSATGELYLTPLPNASFTVYNPFDVAEELLMHIVNLGDLAIRYEKSEKNQDQKKLHDSLITFAKRFGLLGLVSSSAYNRDIAGDDQVLLIQNNHVTTAKTMLEDEYINLFTPFVEKDDVIINTYKNCVDIVKAEDSPKFYGKRPVILDLVFSRFYAEKVDWLLSFAKVMSKHFDQLMLYKDKDINLAQDVTILAGEFEAHKIGFVINHSDKTSIAWSFDALKTAIETIYAFAVTDDSIAINRCVHCHNLFIGNNIRSIYCDPVCRNRENVRRSRARKSSPSES